MLQCYAVFLVLGFIYFFKKYQYKQKRGALNKNGIATATATA